MGVRPSSIKIIMKNVASAATKTNVATVLLIENMGNENYIYLNINSQKIIAKAVSEIMLKIGEEIKFSFEEEDMHLFDREIKVSLKK